MKSGESTVNSGLESFHHFHRELEQNLRNNKARFNSLMLLK